MEAFEQSKFEARRKRSHTVVHENFEGSLLKWISQARSPNVPLRVIYVYDRFLVYISTYIVSLATSPVLFTLMLHVLS